MNHPSFIFCCLLFIGASVSLTRAKPVVQPGDRVAIVGNTFADQMRKFGFFETGLRQVCPGVSVRNLGWAGDTVDIRARPTNFPREDDTLAAFKADVLLLCFGMGESFSGEAGLAPFTQGLNALVAHYQGQQYNGKAAPRVVLVSPIAGQDLGARTPYYKQQRVNQQKYTAAIRAVAEAKDLSFIDLFTPSAAWPANPKRTTNGLHLNEAGYRAVAPLLVAALAPEAAVAADGKKLAGGALALRVDAAWNGARAVKIPNLPPAYYTLAIDGLRSITATHAQWASGVVVTETPSDAAETLRRAVIDKNAQFNYGWKALNQVHIVGERKKSNSGRALPGELKEFDQLAVERDAGLKDLRPPGEVRTWRLAADPERKLP